MVEDYKPKYFSRRYESAKSTYLQEIASDLFTEHGELSSELKRKEDLETIYIDENWAAEMDYHRLPQRCSELV